MRLNDYRKAGQAIKSGLSKLQAGVPKKARETLNEHLSAADKEALRLLLAEPRVEADEFMGETLLVQAELQINGHGEAINETTFEAAVESTLKDRLGGRDAFLAVAVLSISAQIKKDGV